VLAADVFVAVHLTVTESNAIRIQERIERLSREGVKAISLSVQDTRLVDKLTALRNYASELGLELVWDIPVPYGAMNPVALETSEDNPPPGAGHTWLYIEPDGDVLAGQGLPKVMGNFLTDPWEKIWNG
jgi:MoaA/NifB/PqqE/SkfB family radical SAM enzyme